MKYAFSFIRTSSSHQLWMWLAAAFLAILTLYPPHALDLALTRIVYAANDHAWSQDWFWAQPAYRWAKVLTTIVGVGLLAVVLYDWKKGRIERAKVLGAAFVSMIVGLLLVTGLKDVTGVACPWSLEEFSSSHALLTDPFAWLFSAGGVSQGRCWPSGHAGTGFALIGLYFAAKRLYPKCATATLVFVLAFGTLCSVARMMQGAHFLSHCAATLATDWLVASVVFACLPEREKKVEQMTPMRAAAISAAVLTVLAQPFFTRLLEMGTPSAFWATLGMFLLLWVLYTAILYPIVRLMSARGWRIVLAILGTIAGVAVAFNVLYGTVMTADMIRNALVTDMREAKELLGLRLVWTSVLFALPVWIAALKTPAVKAVPFSFQCVLKTTATAALLLACSLALIASQMSTTATFIRQDKQARYFIVPVSVIYSFVRTMIKDSSPDRTERTVIDSTPTVKDGSTRPLLVVTVVGETARIANWGLAGYERMTTPELAKKDVIAFNDVTACGTSTDVSLPCMFSRVGRNNYDRKKILSQESVLSVIERAGVAVRWADNQSGCKGVCTPTMLEPVTGDSQMCPDGNCYDEALVANVDAAIAKAKDKNRQLLVLHMIGSHGPAYYKRVPPELRAFGDGCQSEDMGACSPQAVRDAYDNTIHYTDRVLGRIIDDLNTAEGVDTVLLYVSDHGESLGEKNLWLHGAPYWAGIDEQTKVPMVLWLSAGAKARFGVTDAQLKTAAKEAVSHDNLFDTLLHLNEVNSGVYDARQDLIEAAKRVK